MVDIQKPIRIIDRLQQRHPILSFPVAVIKKYGDDQGGYQAALITYYGFLSLFPLLLVLTTVLQWIPGDSGVRGHVIKGATNYFPIIGNQLQHNVHGFSKTGLPLIVGLLVLFYGARGVSDAFRNAANNIWRIPHDKRSSFWSARAKNFQMIILGGIGFIGAAVVASYAGATGHDYVLRIVLLAINLILLFAAFQFLMRTALARKIHLRDIWVGAAFATIGLFVLQNLGGYIITHELKNLDNLYGTFAVVLGLLFWLYLQTQLIVYAMEVDTVRKMKLWPRSIL